MTTAIDPINGYRYDREDTFLVRFYEDRITTVVTSDPDAVTDWLSETRSLHIYRRKILVGLDATWRPTTSLFDNYPVATLQLCVGRRCLVYRLYHTPRIPYSLFEFLEDMNCTFVGVRVSENLAKLEQDYGFGGLATRVDLCVLAARALQRRGLIFTGLGQLCSAVLGRVLEKPLRIVLSRWDRSLLTREQVMYACLDAFVSYEIGNVLHAWNYGF